MKYMGVKDPADPSSFVETGGADAGNAQTTKAKLHQVKQRLAAMNAKMKEDMETLEALGQQQDEEDATSLLQTRDPDEDYDPGNLHLKDARTKAKEETNELRRTIDEDAADFDKANHVVASQESSLLQTGAKEEPRELEMDDETKAMQRETKSLKHTDDLKLRKFLQDQKAFEHSELADASSLLEKHAAARGKHQAKARVQAHAAAVHKRLLDVQKRLEGYKKHVQASLESMVEEAGTRPTRHESDLWMKYMGVKDPADPSSLLETNGAGGAATKAKLHQVQQRLAAMNAKMK